MRHRLFAIMMSVALLAGCGGGEKPEPEPPKPEKLLPPSNVMLLNVTGETLEFSWDAALGATGYGCRLLKGMTLLQEPTAEATSIKFEGLEPGTLYRFAVKSLAKGSESYFSSFLEAATENQGPDEPDYPDPIGTPDQVLSTMKIPTGEEDGVARAFPGAEGGGMFATGGRGGKVYHVTNLNDSGEGSLRWAVEQKGARTIVFDVAGTIALSKRLEIKNGDLTIAGQTAPGDGICLKNYTTYVGADNVIVRFLRFRIGDEGPNAGDSDDAIWGRYQQGIIIDHCSMSWSIDECASFYANKDFTLQWCILTESMRNCSKHSKGSHGYGGIWGGDNASFHHNLLSNHDSRNPRFDHDYVSINGSSNTKGPNHFINNVIYNWGSNSAYGGESGKGASAREINMVNNYFKSGPSSSNKYRIVNPTTKCDKCNSDDKTDVVPGRFHITGNFMFGSDAVTDDNWKGVEPDDKTRLEECRASGYAGSHTGTLHSAKTALSAVLAYAGASLRRDMVDRRACDQVDGNTGALIDDIADVTSKYGRSWPELKADEAQVARVKDSDGDGIPDYYEVMFGLDMNNPSDGAAYTIDSKAKRYTNLELYLHYLVREIVAGQVTGGTYQTLKK